VGPRAGLDECGKFRPHRDSIPGPSSPWRIAIPTALPGPQLKKVTQPLLVSLSVKVCDDGLKFSDLIEINTAARMKKVMLEPSVTAQIFSYLVNMFRPFKAIITYGNTPLIRIGSASRVNLWRILPN
jgi:hypothetical protein